VVRGSRGSSRTSNAYKIRVTFSTLADCQPFLPRRTDFAAVEIAWRSGLVVVAASGNDGPTTRNRRDAPGYRYVCITVGARDDRGTVDRGDRHAAHGSPHGAAPIRRQARLVAHGGASSPCACSGSAHDTMFPERSWWRQNGSILCLTDVEATASCRAPQRSSPGQAGPHQGSEVKALLVGRTQS